MGSGIIILAIAGLGVVAVWYFQSRPARTSPEDVAAVLRSLRNRTIADTDWDHFVSVKIKNPHLEAARREVVAMWVEGSPFMISGSVNPSDLNAKGVARLDMLISEVETLCRRTGVQ